MATKLKDLTITGTDLVYEGANPEAHIRLFKRKDEPKIVQEDTGNMKIDKSKMTPEEQTVYAELEKKYGVAEPESAQKTEGPSTPEMHPEVRKALDEAAVVRKAHEAQIEELKKSLELSNLTVVAKKYELLGKKPDELAEKLYGLKKAGGTAYDDYVALLDESVALVEKSGAFSEIGKNLSGSISVGGELHAKADEIRKANAGMSQAEAFTKAYETYPDLAEQYEKNYRGRA